MTHPTGTIQLSDVEVEALRRELGAWFAEHRRALPWRRDRDAYRVWISEAMLQQTRVETVIPYFERFLARLPDVRALAAAGEEEVVALWSGLGYYRRARALRAAARVIVDEHDGRFPAARAAALALPGVGPYTAGAVLSIAYGLPEPLVDGNVARVFARLFELEAPLGSTELSRELGALAARLVPRAGGLDPGDWNQALMELGALVCTPRSPGCPVCPLSARCGARGRADLERIPRPKPRRPTVDVRLELLLMERGGKVLLARRAASGRMAGMWELPTRELDEAPASEELRPSRLWPADHDPAVRALRPRLGARLAELTHGITHHRIRAELLRATPGAPKLRPAPSLRWTSAEERGELALTGLTRKALRAARAGRDAVSPPG